MTSGCSSLLGRYGNGVGGWGGAKQRHANGHVVVGHVVVGSLHMRREGPSSLEPVF